MTKDKPKKSKASKADAPPSLFLALSHVTRREVLRIMLGGDLDQGLTPAEAADILGRTLSNVSYHFKILAGNDAVRLVKTRPTRGAVEHVYVLSTSIRESRWVKLALREARATDKCPRL